jgi:hypothetical protein
MQTAPSMLKISVDRVFTALQQRLGEPA